MLYWKSPGGSCIQLDQFNLIRSPSHALIDMVNKSRNKSQFSVTIIILLSLKLHIEMSLKRNGIPRIQFDSNFIFDFYKKYEFKELSLKQLYNNLYFFCQIILQLKISGSAQLGWITSCQEFTFLYSWFQIWVDQLQYIN